MNQLGFYPLYTQIQKWKCEKFIPYMHGFKSENAKNLSLIYMDSKVKIRKTIICYELL